jgi:uncharacterized protein
LLAAQGDFTYAGLSPSGGGTARIFFDHADELLGVAFHYAGRGRGSRAAWCRDPRAQQRACAGTVLAGAGAARAACCAGLSRLAHRGLDAFLLAFDQDAPYDSPNFLWFRARYPRFVYIDRIAVTPSARGRGLARLLYCDLFDAARRRGHTHIACEVNVDPPNPTSDAFHAALGFVEVGCASIHDGSKTVRYLERTLHVTTRAATKFRPR